MCDRIDENQDPLQKISWQLSELLSAQQTGQLAPELESSHWTQFSGIPSQAGPTTFPNLYPWNPLSVSSRNSADAVGNGHYPAVYEPNDCLGDSASSLQNGPSHTPWIRDNASFPHQTFHGSNEFGGGYFDVRSPYAYAHNHQLESHRSGCVENSLLPQQGSTNSQRGFGVDGNSVIDPSNLYASSEYVGLEQTSHALNVSPSSHFSHVSYSAPKSPSAVGPGSDHLNESLEIPGLQASPPLDSSGSPFTFQNRDFTLGTRSLSHDPSLDLTSYLSSERKSSVGLDLGFSLEKRSSVPEAEISSAVDGRRIYTEALSKWHSFDSDNISPTLGSDFQSSSQTSSEPSSPDLSKPSYSDIAKTPKSSQPSVSKLDQPVCDNFQKNQSSRVPRKDIKTSRSFVRRSASNSKFWPRGSSGEYAELLKMPTNSRYGLDSFDDKLVNSGSPHNCSDLQSTRKESESTLHSSISSLDDILPGMSSQQVTSGGGDASPQIGIEKRTEKMSLSGCGSPSSAKPASTQKFDKREEEPLFFDPRRIFQTKSPSKSKTQSSSSSTTSNRQVGSKTCEQEHTVLNNGKPTACSASSKLPTTARKHDYINNDLRDSSKLTNQTAAEVSNPTNSNHDTLHQHRESKPGSGRRLRGRSSSSSHGERKKSPEKRAQADSGTNYEYNAHRGLFWSHVDLEKLEEWCSKAFEKLTACLSWLVTVLVSLLIYTLGIILYLSSSAVHLLCLCIGKCWTLLKERVFGYGMGNETNWSSRDFPRRKVGLEENIVLPSTGDEAMKRLLSCKGKDPYSILGVRADSSEDDIKKYYKKQAILVHPDKNTEPGAEEAFKILGHAFEMIGDPVKRKQYDSHTQEEFDADAMRAFAEMLSKLQAKIQEAANIMPCDNCGGKHRRCPVDRPFYSARFCARCNIRHPAKEGDVWAESTMLGFLWHYYALMEGRVYEITEWMRCHQEVFKHMKANDHSVVTRIANGGGNRKAHYRSTAEPNMEEFINRLFKASERNANRHSSGGHPQHTGAEPGWGHAGPGPAGAASSAGGGKKSGRRNKKKRT